LTRIPLCGNLASEFYVIKKKMPRIINTFGISKRQFTKLLTLKDVKAVRYRLSAYGKKNKIPFDFPLPDDNGAFIAKKVFVVDKLYITGIDPSENITEIFYSLFSKQKLQELQEKLNILNDN
jgi:hypothetical protein